jgi:hypothetical protein
MSPYALARENAKFPYTSANQFTRNAPFLLIYVVHPWFGSTIHHDFAEAGTCFTRSFARRAFMQFSNCADPVQPVCSKVGAGLTFAEASKCLSGMLFINAWPADLYPPNTSDARHASSWLYLNPRATHKIFEVDAELLAQPRTQVLLDNFADDDY